VRSPPASRANDQPGAGGLLIRWNVASSPASSDGARISALAAAWATRAATGASRW